MHRRPSPTCQRSQPGAQGSLKPLDIVGGVDHRASTAMRGAQSRPHRRFRTAHHAPNHPSYPSSGIAFDRLGYQETLRQKESRAHR